MKTEKIQIEKLYRSLSISEERKIDEDKRTLVMSFSSEEPYQRHFGTEILIHDEKSVDLSRLNNGAPLLKNHNSDEQIGVVEKAWIENKRGMAQVRFSRSARGEEIYQDVKDGICRNVSVGYQVRKMDRTMNGEDTECRATDWFPLELSIVSVPADATVGIGRNAETKFEVEVSQEDPKHTKAIEAFVAGIRARAVEVQ